MHASVTDAGPRPQRPDRGQPGLQLDHRRQLHRLLHAVVVISIHVDAAPRQRERRAGALRKIVQRIAGRHVHLGKGQPGAGQFSQKRLEAGQLLQMELHLL